MEKIKINMTEEVNNAIIKVITNKYKKDCPEAHKLVQDWGYTIEKIDGSFQVINETTHKTVSYRHYWKEETVYLGRRYFYFKNVKDLSKINFVKYLNTPYNDYLFTENGYARYTYNKYKSDAVRKYEVLRLAKHNAEFCRDEIISQDEKLKRAIEDYQRWTKYYKEQAEKHDKEIADLRKEYGLTK